jgi:hypothetical protein
MDDERDDMGEDGAARAFAELAREVSLLRAAIGGLTAAREAIDIPDYQPTLARTEKILAELTQRIDMMGKSPAMSLTPETMGQRIKAAVADASNELRGLIHATSADMASAAQRMQGIVRSRRDRAVQDRWLYAMGAGGVIAGMLFYAGISGPIARSMPDSWRWPERMATSVLGEPTPWDAGKRLMQGAWPGRWNAVVASNRIVTANQDALAACRKTATKAKKPVRCTIEIGD